MTHNLDTAHQCRNLTYKHTITSAGSKLTSAACLCKESHTRLNVIGDPPDHDQD